MGATTYRYLAGKIGAIAVHHIDMLNALSSKSQLTPRHLVSSCLTSRLMHYTQDAFGVTLLFEAGTSGRADVLIGADGIGSYTRKTMYTKVRAVF